MIRSPSRAIIAPEAPEADSVGAVLDAEVLRVLDGDGFLAEVRNPLNVTLVKRVSFRFAFIDAPEVQQPCGCEAKDFLTELISNKRISLTLILKESTGFQPLDHYKRALCMAHLTEEMNAGEIEYFLHARFGTGIVKSARTVTRNVELEMLINGWAWVLKQYAFDRKSEYMAAQDDARKNRRGLWAMNNPEPPWKFKERQKRKEAAADRRQASFLDNYPPLAT